MANFYDMEREGRAAYQLSDAGENERYWTPERQARAIRMTKALDECGTCGEHFSVCICPEDIGGNVEPDRIAANMAFSEWLDSRGDALAQPDSFEQWLEQTQDVIDPKSLDYSRGVKIIRDKDGKLHFRPKLTQTGDAIHEG